MWSRYSLKLARMFLKFQVISRVLYYRILKTKNNFEITAFLSYERETSRAVHFIIKIHVKGRGIFFAYRSNSILDSLKVLMVVVVLYEVQRRPISWNIDFRPRCDLLNLLIIFIVVVVVDRFFFSNPNRIFCSFKVFYMLQLK